jgi:DNA-binding SARP family transcriptional activator
MYEIRMFGGLEVRTRGVRLAGGDFGGVEPRHILALLALHGTLGRTDLVDLLWEGHPPDDHAAVLASHVGTLRARLDPDGSGRAPVRPAGAAGFALDADRARTDVARFDELVGAARGRTPVRALPPLTAAVHLAGRPLLAGEDERGWAAEAREHYRNRLLEALLGAADQALVTGEPATARDLAGRVLALEPRAERGWFVTMAAHRALGDRVAALRAYEECRCTLVGGLAVEPSPPVRALFMDVLRDGGSLDGVDARVGYRAARRGRGARRSAAAGRRSEVPPAVLDR